MSKNQLDAILGHFENRRWSITQKEAVNLYGVWRLSAIIQNLREGAYIKGAHHLITVLRACKNNGHYAEYVLVKRSQYIRLYNALKKHLGDSQTFITINEKTWSKLLDEDVK